ncbi:hypothetical protein B0J14DRAFT_603122, partial [Halenospora varia]
QSYTCAGFQKQLEEQQLSETEKKLRPTLGQELSTMQAKLQEVETALKSVKADQGIQAKTQNVTASGVTTIKRDLVSAQTDVSRLKADMPDDLRQKLDTCASQLQDVAKLESEFRANKADQDSKFRKITEDTKLLSSIEGRLTESEKKLKQSGNNMITLLEDQKTALTSYEDGNMRWQNSITNRLQTLEQRWLSSGQQLMKEDLTKLKQEMVSLKQPSYSGVIESLQSKLTAVEQESRSLGERVLSTEEFRSSMEADKTDLATTSELEIVRSDVIDLKERFNKEANPNHSSTRSSEGTSLTSNQDMSELSRRLSALEDKVPSASCGSPRALSADIAQLKDALEDSKTSNDTSYGALRDSIDVLTTLVNSITNRVDGQDKVASELRSSYNALSELTGRVDSLQKAQSPHSNSGTPGPASIMGQGQEVESETAIAASKTLDILKSRSDLLPTQALEQNFTDHITQLRVILESQDEQHTNSIANLESRYNNINTLDLHRAMVDSAINDRIVSFERQLETVRLAFVALQARFIQLKKLSNDRKSLAPEIKKRIQELEQVRSQPQGYEERIQKFENEQRKFDRLLMKLDDNSTKLQAQAAGANELLEKIPNQEQTRQLRGEIDRAVLRVSHVEELGAKPKKAQTTLTSEIDELATKSHKNDHQTASQFAETFTKVQEIERPDPPAAKGKSRSPVESNRMNDTDGKTGLNDGSLNTPPPKNSMQGSLEGCIIDSDTDEGGYEAMPEAPSGDEDDE